MTQEERYSLETKRGELLTKKSILEAEINDITERLRIDPEGHDPDDFSRVVSRLREKGVLPPKSTK